MAKISKEELEKRENELFSLIGRIEDIWFSRKGEYSSLTETQKKRINGVFSKLNTFLYTEYDRTTKITKAFRLKSEKNEIMDAISNMSIDEAKEILSLKKAKDAGKIRVIEE